MYGKCSFTRYSMQKFGHLSMWYVGLGSGPAEWLYYIIIVAQSLQAEILKMASPSTMGQFIWSTVGQVTRFIRW